MTMICWRGVKRVASKKATPIDSTSATERRKLRAGLIDHNDDSTGSINNKSIGIFRSPALISKPGRAASKAKLSA